MLMTSKRRHHRRSSHWGSAFTALFVGMAILSACAPRTNYWSPAESPKKNRVSWAEFHHPVNYAGKAVEPTKTEREALLRFLNRVGRGQGVRITLASTSGNGTGRGLQRETALADLMRDRGFQVALGPPGPPNGVRDNNVRVTIGRYVSKPPVCPDWSKPATGDPANQVTSNFGCATATNLGLMVADPGVLVRGNDLGPADSEAVAVGIKDYREGKEAVAPPTSSLKISVGSGG